MSVGWDVATTTVWVPVGRSLVIDRNTKSVMVCVPFMIASPERIVDDPKKIDELELADMSVPMVEVNAVLPDEDTVVDSPKAAAELEPEERFGPRFVVMVVLPDGDGVLDNARRAGGLEVEEMSVPVLVVVTSLRNVAEVGLSLTPGGEGGEAGVGTGSGGGHDCHSQTISLIQSGL